MVRGSGSEVVTPFVGVIDFSVEALCSRGVIGQ